MPALLTVLFGWYYTYALAPGAGETSQHAQLGVEVPLSAVVKASSVTATAPIAIRESAPSSPTEAAPPSMFSGFVVDSSGNRVPELTVYLGPIEDVAGGRSTAVAGSTDAQGNFAFSVPHAWQGQVMGATVASVDGSIFEFVKVRVREQAALVVTSPFADERRIRGSVRVMGPVARGKWMLSGTSEGAAIVGAAFADHVVDLSAVPTHLNRAVWKDQQLLLTIYSDAAVPMAVRRFDGATELDRWLASSPEVLIGEYQVDVPRVDGVDVAEVSLGFALVQQLAIAFTGRARPENGRLSLLAERDTKLTIVARSADARVLATALLVVDAADQGPIDWVPAMGVESARVHLRGGGDSPERSIAVKMLPVLASSTVVVDTWCMLQGMPRASRDAQVVEGCDYSFENLAKGTYQLLVKEKNGSRATLDSRMIRVPGDAVEVDIGGVSKVYFECGSDANGRQTGAMTVGIAAAGTNGACAGVQKLVPGIGGWSGYCLKGVRPGSYAYCVRGDGWQASGECQVARSTICTVALEPARTETVGGVIEGVTCDGFEVALAGREVEVPWLRAAVAADGAFTLALPEGWATRGLELLHSGVPPKRLAMTSPGRWREDR